MSEPKTALFGGLSARILGSLGALAGIAVLMFLIRPADEGATRRSGGAGTAEPLATADSRCDRELARILGGMKPGRLGISSDRVPMTDELNRWALNCGLSREDESALSGDLALLERLMDGEGLARTKSERYLPEDASHVRESLLARAIVEHVTGDARSDTQRAVELFDFVVRYVSLLPDEVSAQTPLTPYEALLFGIGTAADRAWTYAALLRQIRLDAVILQPKSDGKRDHWLVGVIVPRAGVLLFDARLGLPVPTAQGPVDDTAPFPSVPATLREVLEGDDAFRGLDLPGSVYPLTSEDLKEVDVFAVGSSSLWAPRMAELQFMLPAGYSVELYDGLGENALRQPGLYQRIVEAGEGTLWPQESVSVWEHPERQVVRIEAARGAEGTQLAELFTVFRGPYVPRQDPRTGQIYEGTTEHTLHYVRIEQLMGEHADALKHFLPIRTSLQTTQLPANRIAADYAALWTAVSQHETGKESAALGTFERYVQSHRDGSGLARSAFEWGSRCYIASGDLEAAVRLLAGAPRGLNPHRDAYLVQRWLKLAGAEADGAGTPQAADEEG